MAAQRARKTKSAPPRAKPKGWPEGREADERAYQRGRPLLHDGCGGAGENGEEVGGGGDGGDEAGHADGVGGAGQGAGGGADPRCVRDKQAHERRDGGAARERLRPAAEVGRREAHCRCSGRAREEDSGRREIQASARKLRSSTPAGTRA